MEMSIDLLKQLIFECAADLARGEDSKENIVRRLLELSDVTVKLDNPEKPKGAPCDVP